jgi:hypothetical protein
MFPFLLLRRHAAFMLVVLAVFVVIAGSVVWRHRESVFDTIEFEGGRLFKKAVITTLVLAAVAYLALVIINNL